MRASIAGAGYVAAFVGVLFGAACSPDAAVPATGPEAHPLLDWPAERLVLTEELRIDGTAEELVPIRDVTVAPDGVMALIQDQDHQVRFFSPEGESLGTVGRDGEGPGEFTMVSSLGWAADSLWVFDFMQQRFSLFGPDRSFVRTMRAPLLRDVGGRELRMFYLHLYPDGSTLAFHTGEEDDAGEELTTYVRMSSDGGAIPSDSGAMTSDGASPGLLARYPTVESGISVQGEGFSAGVGVPFVSRELNDVSARGDRLVLATAFLEGRAEGTFAVTAVDQVGDTVFAHRYPVDLVAIPPTVADSAVGAARDRLENFPAEMRQALQQAFDRDIWTPAFYPPLDDVVAGRDGTIWITMRETEEGLPCRVIAPDGAPIGTVMLDEDQTIVEAERSTVWVVERDELGIPSLVRYAVESS